MNKFLEYWEEANYWISRIPYDNEVHNKVLRLQEKAKRELESMKRNLNMKPMEVPVIA